MGGTSCFKWNQIWTREEVLLEREKKIWLSCEKVHEEVYWKISKTLTWTAGNFQQESQSNTPNLLVPERRHPYPARILFFCKQATYARAKLGDGRARKSSMHEENRLPPADRQNIFLSAALLSFQTSSAKQINQPQALWTILGMAQDILQSLDIKGWVSRVEIFTNLISKLNTVQSGTNKAH